MEKVLNLTNELEDLLKTILDKSGKVKAVVVGKGLFNLIGEDTFIYTLGHFSISIKPMLLPFCNFLMDKTVPNDKYYIFEDEEKCDLFLLQNYYKDKKQKFNVEGK